MATSKIHRIIEMFPEVERMNDWPLFVFSPETTQLLANSESAHKSLEAMIDAEVAHLPYPKMLVQYPCGKNDEVIALGSVTEHDDGEFRATTFFLDERNKQYSKPDAGVTFKFAKGRKISDHIKVFVNAYKDLEYREQRAYASHGIIAVRLAILMSHIGGLEREHIEPSGKLNKAREKKGKPALTPYSYVHVAKVYDSNGVAHSRTSTGKHMPVHMRAGHTRRQHYGKDNAETKLIWIPPVLVNYKPDAAKPRIEKRVVS